MSTQIPFTYNQSEGKLTLMLDSGTKYVYATNPNFREVVKAVKEGKSETDVLAMLNKTDPPKPMAAVLRDASFGKVKLEGGKVYYDGVLCEDTISKFILLIEQQGLPVEGAVRFMEKLYMNVSHRVRKELFGFMDRNGLTITDDGCFLAYKAVRSDYMDKYQGVFSNRPGDVPTMDRALVDDNYQRGCSRGLHAGALVYVAGYGSGNDRIVIVKIDPVDVVSVPSDCSCQKIRTCKYTVIGDFQGGLKNALYSAEKTTDQMYDEDRGSQYDGADEFDDYDNDMDEDFDDDYEEEDDDWDDEDDDLDDEEEDDLDDEDLDDDDVVAGSVTVGHDPRYAQTEAQKQASALGKKPSGQSFWNLRNALGRFSKR